MGIVNKIRTLGAGFVFETLFERIVPAWMFRFCCLAVYQLDLETFSSHRLSAADVTVCDSNRQLEQLREITSDFTAQHQQVGLLATVDDQVAGGLWLALGNYEDRDLGLRFLLDRETSWVYSARVDAAYRRQGIYSHLMCTAAKVRSAAGHPCPHIGVSSLNKGSRAAIERHGIRVGTVRTVRVGSIVWARASGRVKQKHSLTLGCVGQPIEFSLWQSNE